MLPIRVRATTAATTLALLLLAGCGGPDEPAADPRSDPSTGDAATGADADADAQAGGIDHPTGADDVVIRIASGGGLVPVEQAATRQPTLLLTGDGRLLLPPTEAGSDGPRTPRLVPMQVARVEEDQVQALLALAAGAGLLSAPPDYRDSGGPQVTDAPTTTVTLAAAGGTWEHEAYALGFDRGTEARRALRTFVDAASEAVTGLATEPFAAPEVALLARPTDRAGTVVDWPADDVVLAEVGDCSVVPAGGLVDLLSASGSDTAFRQGGAVYSVAGAEVLPGDEPCSG